MAPSGIEPATFHLVAQCSATSTIIKESRRKHTKQELYAFDQRTNGVHTDGWPQLGVATLDHCLTVQMLI